MPKNIIAKLEYFEKAVRAHEAKGAQPPEDQEAIEWEYQHARKSLVNALYTLTRHLRTSD